MGRKLRFRRFLRRKDSMDSDRLSVQTLPAIIEHEESVPDRLPGRRTSLSVLCLMRDGSINTVKQLVKLFEMKTVPMSEGRKTQVILLDDKCLELLVQPKLYSTELLDIVASHFNLKEKEYFGLSFKDDTGHHHWLHLDRKVLEHEFPKKVGPLVLYFGVRFFIESIGYLRDNSTIELFYLQAKQAIYKSHVEVDTESVFELAAHVLQASFGDYTDDETAKKQLKKLPVLPTSVLREHPSLGSCDDQVLAHYRKLEGHTRGSAIVNYMTIVESLPTYGIHYYTVKDKSSIPWWLGLSYKGISLYDYVDKRVPRKVFAWKQLENLYFRDKKFSIEVHDPKRIVHTLSSFNLYEDAIQEPAEEFDDLSDAISDPTTQVSVSRRTFGPGNVNVHAWFAATPLLTKCIWSMAVSQHQFYLDRKQSKSQLPQVRSMSEIATDLCHSSGSLHSSLANSDGISRSNSIHSLTLSTYNSRTELTFEELELSRNAQRDMYEALEARKKLLEEVLKKKTEELKQICLKEGELTGVLPKETPLVPGEPVPQIRRRVGTSFALSPTIFNRDKTTEVNETLARLELDMDLQDKISKAAYRLAQDKSVAKSVRKQRKQQYHKAHQKLKDIEKKLNEFRECIGKIPVKMQSSMEDLSEDSREFLDSESEFISPVGSMSVNRNDIREVGTGRYSNSHHPSPNTPHMKIIVSPKVEVVELESLSRPPAHTPTYHGSRAQYYPSPHKPYTVHPADYSQGHPQQYHHGNQYPSNQVPTGTGPHPQHKSAPASPVRQPHGAPRVSTPSPNPGRNYRGSSSGGGGGYIPNSVYSTRTSYRDQMYPTYSTKDQSGSQSDYENSTRSAHQSSNVHVSRIDRENYRNDVHNLYNVNSNNMSCYESADELKSPASEDYDSYCSDNEQGMWKVGLDGSHQANTHQPRGYGSLDRNTNSRDMLSELSPSKFGSKRESHSDYRDSPYQAVDMPPLPRNMVEPLREVPSNGQIQNYDGSSLGEVPSQGENSSHNNSIPFIDCSQSSISMTSSSSGAPWYDPKDHGGGGTQFESPPTPLVRQEVQTYENSGYPGYEQAPNRGMESQQHAPGQPKMTVMKYQSYVEVSKPFEMADYYKYSERLRRQRVQDSPPSSVGSGSTPQSPHHVVSSSSRPGTGRAQYHSPGQNPHSGGSGYTSSSSSRSRPSSPYSQHLYTPNDSSTYSKHSSPYPAGHGSSGGAQSNLVQTSYPSHVHVAQQQSTPYQSHSPKHIAYQPPKPMTCQAVRESPANNSTHNKSLTHRYMDESQNRSFGSFDMGSDGVAKAFSEEMLAWYDDKDVLAMRNGLNDPYTLV